MPVKRLLTGLSAVKIIGMVTEQRLLTELSAVKLGSYAIRDSVHFLLSCRTETTE